MTRFAPGLVVLLALALCVGSIAGAQEQEGEEETPSPTPVPLDMPTPIPVPDQEPIPGDMPTPVLFDIPPPTPLLEGGETPPAPEDTAAAPAPVEPLPTVPASEPSRVSLKGEVDFKTAADTVWDPENEDVWSNQFFGYLSASSTWGSAFAAAVSGLFEYRHEIGEDAVGEAIPELRELYGRFRYGFLDLYFGYQIVSWGVVDGMNPMDILNPYDYRRVVDMELNYARLGTFMIRPVMYFGPVQLEGVYMPLFTPPRYDIVGSDWALTGQGFWLNDMLLELRTDPQWRQFERLLATWVPEWQDSFRRLLDDPSFYEEQTDIPDQDLTAPEGAVRVVWKTSYVDVSAAYFALWDDMPTLHINPAWRDLEEVLGQTDQGFDQLPPPDEWSAELLEEPFKLTHHRVHSAGLGLAGTWGEVGLRAEGMYSFDRYTYRRDMTAVQRDMASWVFNVDHTFSGDLLLSGLLIQSYLVDREDDFISRGWRHMAAVLGRKTFLDEKLTVEGLAMLDLTYLDDSDWRRFDLTASGWSISPLVTYAVTDPLKISLGANLFGGRDDTPLGFLAGNNRVFGLIRYSF